MSKLSYLTPQSGSPWDTYLAQVDQVTPHLGPLASPHARRRRQTRGGS